MARVARVASVAEPGLRCGDAEVLRSKILDTFDEGLGVKTLLTATL